MTCANVVNKIESFKFLKNAVHLLWGLSLIYERNYMKEKLIRLRGTINNVWQFSKKKMKYSTPKTKCMDEYALVK